MEHQERNGLLLFSCRIQFLGKQFLCVFVFFLLLLLFYTSHSSFELMPSMEKIKHRNKITAVIIAHFYYFNSGYYFSYLWVDLFLIFCEIFTQIKKGFDAFTQNQPIIALVDQVKIQSSVFKLETIRVIHFVFWLLVFV